MTSKAKMRLMIVPGKSGHKCFSTSSLVLQFVYIIVVRLGKSTEALKYLKLLT